MLLFKPEYRFVNLLVSNLSRSKINHFGSIRAERLLDRSISPRMQRPQNKMPACYSDRHRFGHRWYARQNDRSPLAAFRIVRLVGLALFRWSLPRSSSIHDVHRWNRKHTILSVPLGREQIVDLPVSSLPRSKIRCFGSVNSQCLLSRPIPSPHVIPSEPNASVLHRMPLMVPGACVTTSNPHLPSTAL